MGRALENMRAFRLVAPGRTRIQAILGASSEIDSCEMPFMKAGAGHLQAVGKISSYAKPA